MHADSGVDAFFSSSDYLAYVSLFFLFPLGLFDSMAFDGYLLSGRGEGEKGIYLLDRRTCEGSHVR